MTWFEMLVLAILLVGVWALWTIVSYLSAIFVHLERRADWRVDDAENDEVRKRVQEAAFSIDKSVEQLRVIAGELGGLRQDVSTTAS